MKKLLVVFAVLTVFAVRGESVDGLLKQLAAAPSDSSKVKTMVDLAAALEDSVPDESLNYLGQAYALAVRYDMKWELVDVCNQFGTHYFGSGDYDKALRYFLETLDNFEKLKFQPGIANCMNNIGSVYSAQQNFKKALEYHSKALKIRQENFDKGIGKLSDVAMSYGNIGMTYYYLNNYDKAMDYYNKSYKISEQEGNKTRMALMLNNMGSIFAERGLMDNALDYFTKAFEIQKQEGDKERMAMALNNIGEVYLDKKDYKSAIAKYEEGLSLAMEIKDKDDQKNSYDGLHQTYLGMNDYQNAHKYLELFMDVKDSIFNAENTSQVNELLAKYDAKQKEQEISLLQKDQEIHRVWKNALVIGVLLLLLLAIVLWNRNKVKQRANSVLSEKNKNIEIQKTEIENKNAELNLKNKEITDSIKYAKHLQMAILPPSTLVNHLLPENFILYKPKDIVSGDFYWLEEWGTQVLVAAADCTGHGVPGAFMSIVGNNLLHQAVNVYGLSRPFLILNNLNKNISKMLHQTADSSTVRDGMDIALISIDRTKMLLEYAGAYNPLWIIRDDKLIELKADKHPVGAFVGEDLKQFTGHNVELKKNDLLYIFTDGYADQFGGPKGKKFKYKALQELLLQHREKSMEGQKQLLNSTIEKWRGSLEQVDDILIIGIRI